MSARAGITALLVSTITWAACTPPADDNPSIVTSLRILAIQAEPAEVAPGDTVTLHALVVDPGKTRSIELNWYVCLTLLGGQLEGDNPFVTTDSCADTDNLQPISSDAEPELEVPPETGNNRIPIVLIARAGGDSHIALKHVDVKDQPANQNPELTELLISGQEPAPGQMLPMAAGGYAQLEAAANDQGDGDFPFVEYFVTGGAIDCYDSVYRECNIAFASDSFGTDIDYELKGWQLPKRAGEFDVHAVARDTLGGTDWRSYTILIE